MGRSEKKKNERSWNKKNGIKIIKQQDG